MRRSEGKGRGWEHGGSGKSILGGLGLEKIYGVERTTL